MGLFKKKEKVLDLSEKYKRDQEKIAAIKEEQRISSNKTPMAASLGFLSSFANNTKKNENQSSSSGYLNMNSDSDEGEDKRKKLAKRLMDMTERIENLSTQIYKLQQRLEVLERKSGIGY